MLRNITLLKAKGPDQFWVKEVPGPGMSTEAAEFQHLSTRINAYCSSNDTMSDQLQNPSRGQYCLARRTADRTWYRAKIESMLQTTKGTQAKCLLVDYKECIAVSVHRLCDIPEEFLRLPFQSKECRLYGIQPLTLTMSFEDFTTTMKVCTVWDTSAVEFFNDLIKDKSAKMIVHSKDNDDIQFITLYVNTREGQIDVNNELVIKEFAANKHDDMDDHRNRAPSPAPSLESLQMIHFEGHTSSREGSIRALSPDMRAQTQTDRMTSPPLATRRVSPDMIQGEMDEQHSLKERFQSTLKLRKMSPNRLLGFNQVEQGNEPIAQKHHPMEVLSTAEIKENLQQLGRPVTQSKTGSNANSAGLQSVYVSPDQVGSGESLLDERNLFSSPTDAIGPPTPCVKDSTSLTSGAFGQDNSSPLGRGLTIEKFRQSRDSISPVGNLGHLSPSDGRRLSLNSSPEILQSARLLSKLSPSNPMTSDLSSSEDANLDKKQRALAYLQKMATEGEAKLASQEAEQRRASANSTDIQRQFSPVASPEQNRLSLAKSSESCATHSNTNENRLPFRVMPASHAASGKDTTPTTEHGCHGYSVDKNAVRKSVKSVSREPSGWSSDKQSSYSSSDEAASKLPSHIIEQRLNLLMHQPAKKQLHTLQGTRTVRRPQPGVLLHGEDPPEPYLSIDQAPFSETILRVLQRWNLPGPTPIQSYAWRAILRGRNTVGVSPKGSGKMLAYLLPLITQVMQPSVYSCLPISQGPLVLVVCPGWKQAFKTYQECKEFMGQKRKTRVLLIHGAGAEDNNQVQLVNGCDILVVTVCCVLRLLKEEHTNLQRLCHLVMDDADVLFDDFTDEVKELMKLYGAALLIRKPRQKAIQQLIVMASQWTSGLGSFLRQYMTDPVVVITSPLEASVYAHIKWMAKVTSSRLRFQDLDSVLTSCQMSSSKVIVFVNSRIQAEELQKMLVNAQYFTLLAHGEMGSHHIDNVLTEWGSSHRGDSMPVLVMTDNVQQELFITNASCVIHYEFPTSKTKLGSRLGTMMDNFASQIDKPQKSNCQCMLLLSDEDPSAIPSLAQILLRCSRDVTAQLKVEKAVEDKEKKKINVDLCRNLKGLGFCRDFPTCPDRHRVIADIDSPGSQSLYIELPLSGIVRILFTWIVDANCYYGRILEYRSTEGSTPVDMTTKYAQLPMDMAMWYAADQANKEPHGMPKVYQLCAFEDDQHAFHRVRIVKLNKRKGTGVLKDVTVQYVDKGRIQDIPVSKLLKLPARFHSVPFQAVEVFICRVKPLDKDRDWTDKASDYIDKLIYKRELEGKIALSLANTLWLDPLVEREFLQDVGLVVHTNNVRQKLLEERFAEDNPEHLSKLWELCKGQIDLPQLVPSVYSTASSTILRPDTETITEAKVDVYVSAVANPNLIYVQKCSTSSKLEKLMTTIETKLESVLDGGNDWDPQIGDICLAMFPIDGRWARGQIAAKNDSGDFDVFFVDYGDQEWLQRKDLRHPWNDILKLPFQAVECSLIDVGPATGQWEGDTEADALWTMCSDGDQHKQLSIKVKSTMKGQFHGTTCYNVDLYDEKSTERCINIGHQLVDEGHGVGVQGFLKSMFPDAIGEENSISKWLIKLCVELYQTKEKQRQMDLARTIHQLVTNKRCKPSELCQNGALISLCHLVCIEITAYQAVVNNLLVRSLIHVCYNNLRNCKEMCRHGGLKEICHFLSKTEEGLLQEQICWILTTAAGINSTVKRCIRQYGGLLGLCQLLTSDSQSAQVVNSVCTSIAVLATDNLSNQDVIQQSGGVSALCQMLTTTNCDITRREVLCTLSVLATHIRNRDGMRTDGGLHALCELLWESKDEQIITLVTNTLLSLVDNTANKAVMQEEDLIECLVGYLLTTPFSNTTMQSMSDLLSTLTERDRSQKRLTSDNLEDFGLAPPPVSTSNQLPAISHSNEKNVALNGHMNVNEAAIVEIPDDLPPLEEDCNVHLPVTAKPMVRWSQRPDTISLSVELRDVQDFDVDIYRKAVAFSTQLEKFYEFHLNLFSHVITTHDQYKATATGGEVLITLYKETPGVKWPRLTSSKGKFGFVSLDFERWQDDSSDEDDVRLAKKTNKATADKTKNSKKPKLKISKSGVSNAITPEMDTASESDDSNYTDSTRSSDAEFGFADESDPPSAMADSS